jgi:Flp pilus assembly protein TadD
VEHLRHAAALRPYDADIQAALGSALMFLGKPTEAEVHLHRAIELDPKNAEAHFYVAAILVKRGRGEEAARHFSQAVNLDQGLKAKVMEALGRVPDRGQTKGVP